MSDEQLAVGETFPLHFVWQLPEGDYLRALFRAEVLALDPQMEKYTVRLAKFVGARQEDETGQLRPRGAFSETYWPLIGRLQGQKIAVAYEAADGRPLPLRLTTLTGEHNFFFRFDEPTTDD